MSRYAHSHSGGEPVPFGRIAIAVQVIVALLVAAFLISRLDVVLPLVSDTYEQQALLPDAAGLDPTDRPAVVAGGVRIGRVTAVRYDQRLGRAIVTMRLDGGSRGKLFADASLRIAPRSALQDLVVDIDPGTPVAGVLPRGAMITVGPQAAPVAYDRVMGVLDTDTRAYTQILIGTLHELLHKRAGPLRRAVEELPPLTTGTTQLAQQLAARRHDLSALVVELATITAATGRRASQLGMTVRVARRALAVSARRDQELTRSFRELPATLAHVDATFAQLHKLASPMTSALDGLRPTARALPAALRATRELVPGAHGLLDDTRSLIADGGKPLTDLRRATVELGPAAAGLAEFLPTLRKLTDSLNTNRNFMLDLVANWSGAISNAGNTGIQARSLLLGFEQFLPALFGIESPTDRSRLAAALRTLRSRRPELLMPAPGLALGSLTRQAARALLIATCRTTNQSACLAVGALDDELRKGGRP